MKCPKCGYLGFETVDRCRNCGYDFSLTDAPSVPELSMRSAIASAGGPLDDLSLAPPQSRSSADTLRPEPASPTRSTDRRHGLSELPLFGGPADDDVPLITRPSPPRTPLAVRRSTPDVPRLRAESRPSLLDQAAPDHEDPPTLWRPPVAVARTAQEPAASVGPAAVLAHEDASLVARGLAGGIDLALLLAVDAVVVYFTMQICGLSFAEIDLLPKAPLLTYLAIQDLGYFVAFTAGGQTLGKMVTGVQVVADGSDRAPDASHALLRTMLWLLLALPAGLGLASVLLDSESRGLHDRFARTRVVRATV